MNEKELREHEERMLEFSLAKIRADAMVKILDNLADGYPNPEGVLAWLEAKTDEEFVAWWKETGE